MTLGVLDRGTVANDGTGTSARAGGQIINDNFGFTHYAVNVKEHGAVGDGSTDDTAAIQAAIDAVQAAGGGAVWFPPGTYKVTASLVIDASSVSLVGSGFSADSGNANDAPWAAATVILWTNATGDSVIKVNGPVNGIYLARFGIDGNAQATKALDLDMMQASVLRDIGITNMGANGIGLHGRVSGTDANVGFQNNLLEGLWINSPECIRLSGNAAPNANANYNCFVRANCRHGDATNNNPGVVIENGDNNTFIDLRVNRTAGTGVGVDLKDRARSNYFFHLAAGAGGLTARTPNSASYSNLVVGYDRDNGQPTPTLESTANLSWSETGANATGWYVPGFGRIVGFGTITPTLANSGASGIHVQTADGSAPEVRIQAITAASASAFCELVGRSGSSDVRVRLGALSAGTCELNVIPSRSLLFKTNNTERMRIAATGEIILGAGGTGPQLLFGTGVPSASAPDGSLFLRTDGGSGTTLYVRESGAWVAK